MQSGCKADASSVPWSIERVLKRLKKLVNTLDRVKKQSERRTRRYSPGGAQVELGDLHGKADTSQASGRAEETREKPTKLRNASVQVHERSKRRRRRNSPSRPGEEPDKPGGETATPDGHQSDPERPRSVSDKRVDRTNAPCRRNGPSGHLGEPEASRGVEGVRDRKMVVDGAEHNGICPSSRRNECNVKQQTLPGE